MTILNILGTIVAIISIILLGKRFAIASRWKRYLLLIVSGMLSSLIVSIYSLENILGAWQFKFSAMLWWVSTLYFSWSLRFSSIRKNNLKPNQNNQSWLKKKSKIHI
jgi:hypothetical protein